MEPIMRKDVPTEETWDLSLLYKTEEAFEADVEKAKALADALEREYRGKLTEPARVNACLDKYRDFLEIAYLLGSYTSLAMSVDYYDCALQERDEKTSRLMSELFSRLSFIESELNVLDDAALQAAIDGTEANKGYLRDIQRNRPHRLQPETERVLAALSQCFDVPYNVYNMAKLADMRFPGITVGEKEYPMGYSLFEDSYSLDPDTGLRREAFRAFSKKLRDYENVTATAYNAQVQQEKVMATLRGFDSVFDSLLFPQKVGRDLYDRQIDLITQKLAPHMRRYARLLQKIYGLEKMTFADLKIPVDPDYDPKVSIQGSREYIEKGLAIYGPDYVEMVREAYRDRWVDFGRNQGKSTGGFCSSPYGKNSYILLSWNERMSDVFTLAHELGHAGHFRACNGAQSIFDTDVSGYFVEAPSTMNELIMAHYLKGTSQDKRFQRWVLSSLVSNTYYHNFVTHLLEAAYQREVYRIVDAGGSVNAPVLSEIKKKVLQDFWGDAVEIDDDAALTWMRQPHYYMGLYSYTYSAGLTVATQACKRIETEGAPAVEDWKRVLRAGSTLDPVGLAALAGIDITTDAPLLDTIETIGGYIDEIIRLTGELEAEARG